MCLANVSILKADTPVRSLTGISYPVPPRLVYICYISVYKICNFVVKLCVTIMVDLKNSLEIYNY